MLGEFVVEVKVRFTVKTEGSDQDECKENAVREADNLVSRLHSNLMDTDRRIHLATTHNTPKIIFPAYRGIVSESYDWTEHNVPDNLSDDE